MSSLHAIVTAGPTIERLDPVRYISNFSSGKQGYAIAQALQAAGVEVTLVSGPVHLPPPPHMHVIQVESAINMHAACNELLQSNPIDIAICVAAVCDWRPKVYQSHKIKKNNNNPHSSKRIEFIPNPDILKMISHHTNRPRLVIGFAAETESLLENAKAKRINKGCDWIVANHIHSPNHHHNNEGDFSVFNHDQNQLCLIKPDELILFDRTTKQKAATMLVKEALAWVGGMIE